MNKIRLALVSYINTIPFIEAIRSSESLSNKIDLVIDYPARCAEMISSGEVDGGLLPVGAITPELESKILTDYCIGADGYVHTVELFSHKELGEVDTIRLDYQSRTSVRLCKLLAEKVWKRDFTYQDTKPGFESDIQDNEAVLIIGDRVFKHQDEYAYKTDLAETWKDWTGLPFVFALWVGNEHVKSIENELNIIFKNTLKSINKLYKDDLTIDFETFSNYLNNNISYNLDERKKEAFRLFKELLN